ncbi:WAT1-related protein At1g25270-like isoform X1 [Rosa rugosa]|uniref:WAT1-related protein At1g25270-like isoform X1 n=1 Tax=Rosa rugosa TaxID=74645 RepID=UPI002B4120CC|nr:WAT1-related protein At1g25270-like isoform X1 [Rosa rugosa]
MGGSCFNALHGLKPLMLMLVVQFTSTGVNLFYKLAANDGMDIRIIIAYRFSFATVFLAPIALFVERKSRPKLTRVVLLQAFLSGLLGGALSQNLYIASLALTSATFALAISQLIPAITFVLAISFGLERLNLRSVGGKAKVLGTLMGIGGAMLLTFYKGLEIHLWTTHVDLLHSHQQQPHLEAAASHEYAHRLLGCLLALASSLGYALWLIIQAKMGEKYPSFYSSAALISLMGSIQSLVFALCVNRDWNHWKLGWNIRLLTVLYLGTVGTGVSLTCTTLCISMRGPLYASVFGPLVLVLVALVGSLVLDEKLHLGSVLGAVLIVGGLYAVLWGKSKDIKKVNQSVPTTSYEEESAGSVVEIVSMPRDNNKGNNYMNETVTNSQHDRIET